MDAKTISFVLVMGVLGNLLFAISSYAVPLSLGISLDLSLIPVFIAAYYGGPAIGFVSGLFVGIFPGVIFGPLGMGSWLGLFGLPVGKALTGLTAGFIFRGLKLGSRPHSSLLVFPATLLSYVPEALYTYAYFAALLPLFVGGGGGYIYLYFVLPKAIGEISISGVLMATLSGNHGFNEFMKTYFAKSASAVKSKVKSIG